MRPRDRGPSARDLFDEEEVPAAARREGIVALVAEHGHVSVADLAERFGVSAVTARTDLRELAAAGRVRRIHGGAMAAAGAAREPTVEASSERDMHLKRAIGRRAAGLIESGSSLFLDVGSTALAVARALVARQDLADLVVVTNGLSIALALEPAIPRFTVVVTGGTLRPLQHSLVAPLAANTLPDLHVDAAILGCNGIAEDGVVTNLNLAEAEVKRTVAASAGRRILVADTSKFGRRELGRIADLRDVEVAVTAGEGTAAARRIATAAGTRLIVADPGGQA